MLSREVSDLVEYFVIVYDSGWHARSRFVLCCVHFRVIVEMDGTIRKMVVVMVMVMRTGDCCVAGHAYWGAILSFLAMVMMTGKISWPP